MLSGSKHTPAAPEGHVSNGSLHAGPCTADKGVRMSLMYRGPLDPSGCSGGRSSQLDSQANQCSVTAGEASGHGGQGSGISSAGGSEVRAPGLVCQFRALAVLQVAASSRGPGPPLTPPVSPALLSQTWGAQEGWPQPDFPPVSPAAPGRPPAHHPALRGPGLTSCWHVGPGSTCPHDVTKNKTGRFSTASLESLSSDWGLKASFHKGLVPPLGRDQCAVLPT